MNPVKKRNIERRRLELKIEELSKLILIDGTNISNAMAKDKENIYKIKKKRYVNKLGDLKKIIDDIMKLLSEYENDKTRTNTLNSIDQGKELESGNSQTPRVEHNQATIKTRIRQIGPKTKSR